MPPSIESDIQARIEIFTLEVIELVRSSAMEIVQEALGNGAARRGSSARMTARLSPVSRRKGAKRDPKEIAAVTQKLGSYISKNPGQRIELIGGALGLRMKDLALSVKGLIADKTIATKGQRRATTYFPR